MPGGSGSSYGGPSYTGTATNAGIFEKWKYQGYTPEYLAAAGWDADTVAAYAAYVNQYSGGNGTFNPQLPAGYSGPAPVFNPQYTAPAPAPYTHGGIGSGWTGSVYTGMGYAGQPANLPSTNPAPQQQNTGFSKDAWGLLRYGKPFDYNGHTYTNQYNYIGDTLGQANTPEGGSRPGGWDQLNRYGQPLGTGGPMNNKRVSNRINWAKSRTKYYSPTPVVTPWNNGEGPHGTGRNPTRLPPEHGGGGGGGGKNDDTTYTNQYNDLINWRI